MNIETANLFLVGAVFSLAAKFQPVIIFIDEIGKYMLNNAICFFFYRLLFERETVARP